MSAVFNFKDRFDHSTIGIVGDRKVPTIKCIRCFSLVTSKKANQLCHLRKLIK